MFSDLLDDGHGNFEIQESFDQLGFALDLGLRIWGLGFGVWSLGLRVEGLGLRVEG